MNTYIKSTCFLFFFIVQFAYSQEYVPFPKDSAVWYERWYEGDSGMITDEGLNQFYLFGDTIVNGKLYSKLYLGWVHPFSEEIEYNPSEVSFYGIIREDDKKVYFAEYKDYWNGDSIDIANEAVLYDFGMEIGDTLMCENGFQYVGGPSPYESLILENIDTVQMIDGSYRKKYHFHTGFFVIEGVGSPEGLFFPCGADGWHFYNELVCMGTIETYIYDGRVHYSNHNIEVPPDATCYNLYLSTEEIIYQSLTLQPNPTTGIVRLSKSMYDVHLSVYSVIGQKVRDERAFNGSVIDLNGLASGVYFVVILGNENYLGKVVKE